MTSLRTETGKHFVQVFKMWLTVGEKNRFFQSMVVLEESGIPQNLSSPPTLAGQAGKEGTFIQKMKTIIMM